MGTTVSLRDNTNNYAAYDYIKNLLLAGEYTVKRIDYANISGAEESVEIGTVMGMVDATQKMAPCLSTATDGSQEPICILLEPLESIATAGTVDDVLVAIGGKINSDNVVFQNGTDTLATSVTAVSGEIKTMENFLIKNGNNFEFVGVNDYSEYDN